MNLDQKRCIIFDLDGTVYLGDRPIPGTVDFIRRNLGVRDIQFLTNNTSKNLADYTAKLAGMGIHIGLERMLSPLLPLVDHLREQSITRVYPVGNANFTTFLRERMPDIAFTGGDDCQAVLLGYDTELTYRKLTESCLLLQRPEVAFLATHADKVCPSPQGPLPDAGSFMALYEAATGRTPDIVFGKPNTILLRSLLARYQPHEMAMVGDRIYTDKLLAENAGMDFILVLSGETRREDLASLSRQPALVVDDLGGY
ncbi:HAD-IIA family hydrolase [Nitratidesulfovibrio liaohensis]|uniref:HAD-IIA family hydrolase n=1 Tax=Nitratidesulfovibrio liaohensis TaxID=2604158 RepID=A0ABY9R4D1_9BACT|nr:HAD-IIA family hydrolase [Nitratidesulfovibrio liaohensis]WMW66166.1 HAD-IIA family hydrolase [Nitratidesulfovibrio liaohensis]